MWKNFFFLAICTISKNTFQQGTVIVLKTYSKGWSCITVQLNSGVLEYVMTREFQNMLWLGSFRGCYNLWVSEYVTTHEFQGMLWLRSFRACYDSGVSGHVMTWEFQCMLRLGEFQSMLQLLNSTACYESGVSEYVTTWEFQSMLRLTFTTALEGLIPSL